MAFKRKSKTMSVLLTLAMLLTLWPGVALADDPGPGSSTISVTTENELRTSVTEAVYADYTINIVQNIALTSLLTINQNVTLTSASGKTLDTGSNQIVIPVGKNVTFGGDLKVQGSASPGVVNVQGTFTLADNASVRSDITNRVPVYSYSAGATINITGGSVTASNAYALCMEGVGGGTVNVSGGVIEGANNSLRVSGSGYKANISGGEIRGQNAVYVSTGAEADISGGVLTGTATAVNTGGAVDITGGTFTGKILTQSPGTVEMTGGNITFGGIGAGVYYTDAGTSRAFLTALPSSPVVAEVSQPTAIPLSGVYSAVVYSIDPTSDSELGAIINNDTDTVTLTPTAAGNRNLALTATASGQTFKLTLPVTVTSAAPTITGAVMDAQNRYISVTFSEGVYGNAAHTTGIDKDDFTLTFAQNAGGVTGASINTVHKAGSGLTPAGGETQFDIWLKLVDGPPTGAETITINPKFGSIYNSSGVAALDTATTGAKNLSVPAVAQSFVGDYPKEGAPQIPGSHKVQVLAKVAFEGAVYYVLLPNNATSPTAQQIKDHANIDGNPVMTWGQLAVGANIEIPFMFSSNLGHDTEYDVYMVAEAGNNNFSAVKRLDVRTPPPAVINIAAIPGVTAPVTGAAPVTTITETAQYTGSVSWLPADNPFAAGTVYTATITLTPKAGYTLTGVTANFFTVAGVASPATHAANSGVVTAVFPATDTAAPTPAATAAASAATLTPVAGESNEITLTVKNSSGNTDTTFTGVHNVTLSGAQVIASGSVCGSFYSFAIPASGTLTTSVIFTNGVAKPSLSLFKAGSQTISFSVAGVTNPSASVNLTVVPRTPATMTLTQDITAPAVNGGQFAQQPRLELKDSYANPCTNDSATQVTASKHDVGIWTLTGTATVTAQNGIVTFTDLGATNTAQVTNARILFTPTASTNTSLSAQVTLPGPVSPPTVPANLRTTGQTSSSISLAWDASTDDVGVAHYKVEMKSGSGAWVQIGTPAVTQFTQNGLASSTTYLFRVKAVDAAGNESGWSNELSVATTSSGGGGGGGGNSENGNTPSMGSSVTSSGGNVSGSGVTLSIPAGAVENDVHVQVSQAALTSGMSLPAGSQLVSQVVDIIKDQSGNFAVPVTITMSFNQSQIDPSKYDIAICYFDEESGQWVELDNIEIDLNTGTISGQVEHFTKFAVIAIPKATDTQPEPQPSSTLPADISGHWAKKSIVKLIDAGVMGGYPDGSFQPDKTVTRAEFTAMLVKALKLDPKDGPAFTDTTAHWAKESVGTAAAHGLVSGYDQNTFGPDDRITREQAASIIARAAGLQAGEEPLNFSDARQVSPWALSGVAAVVNNTYLSGYPDNSFRPRDYTSRAEAATIIAKLL